MKLEAYPLLLTPVYKDYVWGGDRIARLFERKPPGGRCAESWEVADRADGMSVARNGPLAGRGLRAIVEAYGAALLGRGCREDAFPLLIKVIDARERLSVQVHPDEEAAARFGGEAKTEMWYVLDAAPNAEVFAGLKPGAGEAGFRDALRRRNIAEVLNRVAVRPGQVLFVPGGRLHAIGAGCLMLEIQQNSNTTWRVHDWDRLGQDGRPRALHVEQALQAIRWEDRAPLCIEPEPTGEARGRWRWKIPGCAFFALERLDVTGRADLSNDGRSFHALFAESGAARVEGNGVSARIGRGDSCLIPAALERYSVRPEGGRAALMRISVPG